MKNILRIYKRDIKKITYNWVARLMIIVLIFIPSMYSLINIKASWDPYSNTKGIKIAIVNNDKGTVYKEQDINLGEDLVDNLKDNDKLGWVFTDEDTAKQGLLLEKYYATIEIPEDFSKNVTTLTDTNIIKPQLIYTVNEKKNAIAPKMTDAGIKTVKNQIDENIMKTLSGVLFRVLNDRSVDIEDNRPKLRKIVDNIYELDDNMAEIETLLDTSIDGVGQLKNVLNKTNDMLPTMSDILDNSSDFLNNSKDTLDDIQGQLSDIDPTIKDDLSKSENILDNSSVKLKNLDNNILPEVAKKTLIDIHDSANATKETIDDIKHKLRSLQDFIKKLSRIDIEMPSFGDNVDSEAINALNDKIDKQLDNVKDMQENLKDISSVISDSISRLDKISDKLQIIIDKSKENIDKIDNEGLDTLGLKELIEVVDETHTLVSDLSDIYSSEISPGVEKGINSTRVVLDNSSDIVNIGKETLPQIENILNVSQDAVGTSNDELNNLKDKFPESKDKVHELADKLREMDDEDKIDELLDMMESNWQKQSDFVASPVEIEDNRLFSWPNYGTAATPFYGTLCLWVGALLSCALLSLEAPEFDDETKIRPYEMYFGKLLLFLTIGIFQALVTSVGSIVLLKVSAVHMIMYIFYNMFLSIVFVTFIYTVASILDDVGKTLIIAMLVVQMAGASGNFPIEVTPEFFQKLYPFLPFTYAISGMRQIMAGIVYSILLKDIIVLTIYMVGSLIAGMLLKGIMNKGTNIFMEQLKKSNILRH